MCVREIEGLDTPDAQKTLNTHFLLIFKYIYIYIYILKKAQSKDSKPLCKEIQTSNCPFEFKSIV